MGNLARNIIEGVQHTMLDRLAVRLVPLLWLYSLWERLSPSESATPILALLLGGVVLFILCWTIGSLADLPPKPRRRNVYDQLHESPRSGFPAWERMPDGGIRPPGVMRRLVMILGARPGGPAAIAEILCFIAAAALAWLLGRHSAAFWAGVDPALAAQPAREGLFLAASVAILVLLLRSWATEQRERLEPFVPAPKSRLAATIFITAFSAFMGMLLSDLFGFGLLRGVGAGVALVLVISVLPWRHRVLEFLFGKTDRETAP